MPWCEPHLWKLGGKLQMAIIQGNPMQAGQPCTVRLSCPDGAKIARHWRPTTESVTVLKGTFALEMGSLLAEGPANWRICLGLCTHDAFCVV
jgi:hypothetical protein